LLAPACTSISFTKIKRHSSISGWLYCACSGLAVINLTFNDDNKILSIINLFKNRTNPADRFERFIRPHIDTLYRLAYRLCQTQDGAEDLLQQFLTRLFEKVDQLEKLEKPVPWLKRGLYNLYVDNYRRQNREAAVFSAGGYEDNIAVAPETPQTLANNRDLSQRIENALQALNEDQRIVVLLHDSEGYTLEEISEIQQVPLGTLKSRISRARNILKPLLSMEPLNDTDR
jgi:RNA polymerase sigma-70 factor (ECF subfamily)